MDPSHAYHVRGQEIHKFELGTPGNTQVYKLDPKRLYATYFGGDEKQGLAADDDARSIWCAASYACETWSRTIV